ncbi:MAG: hypothetical protein K6U80_14075, partial [Firmicutes bacterium]|nr:hypothetical protein [Bacillota bacterium]
PWGSARGGQITLTFKALNRICAAGRSIGPNQAGISGKLTISEHKFGLFVTLTIIPIILRSQK